MTCDEFSERVSEYIEGEIGGDYRSAMEHHAADCAGCAHRLRDTRTLTERLSRLPRVRPSAGFDFALRSRLLMELAEGGQWRRRLQNFLFPSIPRALLSGVAVALLALGVTAVLQEGPAWQTQQAGSVRDNERLSQPPSATPDRVAGTLKLLSKEESYTISGTLYQPKPDTSRSPVRKPDRPDRSSREVKQVTVRF